MLTAQMPPLPVTMNLAAQSAELLEEMDGASEDYSPQEWSLSR